jgi:hypothetical protein
MMIRIEYSFFKLLYRWTILNEGYIIIIHVLEKEWFL